MKTVKFSAVVGKCGEPAIYLSWLDPVRDKVLDRALAEHRVMTLHQELHGGKKDFGSVGFLKDRRAQILVFPKSLRTFSERKVIAIDYSLIAKEHLSAAVVVREKPESQAGPAKLPIKTLRDDKEEKVEAKGRASRRLQLQAGRNHPDTNTALKNVGKITTELKRAIKELSAGKSVPAYDRLQRLLEMITS